MSRKYQATSLLTFIFSLQMPRKYQTAARFQQYLLSGG